MRRSVAVAFVLCGLAGPAEATTLSLSWDTCTGPVAKSVLPGTIQSLVVSAIGQAAPHQGYEVRIAVADAGGALPDAWRFDAGGCQGASRISIDHILVNVIGKTCPTFQGALASTQIKSFALATPESGLPATAGVARLVNSYPGGNSSSVPAARYFLMRVLFDHTFSVAGEASGPDGCGGVERGMCFTVLPAFCTWTAADGRVVPFTIGNGTVTANGGACGAVPAAASTWGQIKGQYRR